MTRLNFICLFISAFWVTNLPGAQPEDVTFDGAVLKMPYVTVGGAAYEVNLAPSSDPVLAATDCPILCLKLLTASPSKLNMVRNPAYFDAPYLTTPRISAGEKLFSGKFQYLSQYTSDIYFSVVDAVSAPLFSQQDRQSWTSDELESRFEFCQENSQRWNSLFPIGDFNNDGFTDIFIPIACYQGLVPYNGGENDVKIKSGWFLLCSNPVGSYYNCSNDIFGEEFIDTSKNGGRGGVPYLGNTEEPKDLNNDGYLDFIPTLNRDDAVRREKFNSYTVSGMADVIDQCFEGDSEAANSYPSLGLGNCAYFSDQYVFLSQGDGTYLNVKVPWTRTWTHSLRSLPNKNDGFDIISIGYDVVKAARIVGTKLEDVTEEYKSYTNFDQATQVVPYVGGYFSFDDIDYWVTSGVRPEYVKDIAKYANFNIDTGFYDNVEGITLWKWMPGSGFELSDYYIHPVEDLFNYTNQWGFPKTGIYRLGVPQFGGFYNNFIKKATLNPNEGPVLVVHGETTGFLLNSKRIIEDDYQEIGENTDEYVEDSQLPIAAIQAFKVSEGKIQAIERSIIDGDVLLNSPSLYFRDINNDGYDDLLTMTGHRVNGGAYLNDGNGMLRKVDAGSISPIIPRSSNGVNAYVLWPMSNNSILDILYVEIGAANKPDFWNIGEDGIFRAGDVGIIRGNYPIEDFSFISIDDLKTDFYKCIKKAKGFYWNECSY